MRSNKEADIICWIGEGDGCGGHASKELLGIIHKKVRGLDSG